MAVRIAATVWVCPTPGCGNYYAGSSAGDLTQAWNLDAKGARTFLRADCPDCRVRGKQVQRVPVHLRPVVPEAVQT